MSDSEFSSGDKIAHLKAECLRSTRNVTGLKGKKLAVVLRRSSANEGEYYCALKGQDDKYLKMWMDPRKTYPTHVEALEAYVVFVKKMEVGCSLFSGSPKSKGVR